VILHVITDRQRLSAAASEDARRTCLLRQVAHAVDAGVDVVQVRERDLDARALVALVRDILGIARGGRRDCRVVVNDRVDVALAAGADGVHLRGDSPPPAAVRPMAPPGFVIGRSVHSPSEASSVARDVDYVVAGTVWPTASKRGGGPLLGLLGLADTVRAVNAPVLAVGGITLNRIGDVARQGAAGIAAIGLFMAPSDHDEACRAVSLHDIVRETRERFDMVRGDF
jgi:thiamine-phosphate diphosphorylase